MLEVDVLNRKDGLAGENDATKVDGTTSRRYNKIEHRMMCSSVERYIYASQDYCCRGINGIRSEVMSMK